MNSLSSFNWKEITDEFKSSAKELKLGELVHEELFGLYDAMAAIELMDPKMDAGMICNKNNKTTYKFEEMISRKMLKVDEFSEQELIGIIDDTFSCLVTWMNGHSLAQTVFINLYLHNPLLICDKTLKSFSIVILKIVDMICTFVQKASVFEEEDFQPKTYGFDLATFTSNSKVLTMIKAVDDDLKSQIEKAEKSNDVKLNLLRALHYRINFTKYFFLCLFNFKKQIVNAQTTMPFKQFVAQINENVNNCLSTIDPWLETIDYGVKPEPEENLMVDHTKPNYSTILGFEPLINQRLLPPSFPRYTKIKSRADTVSYLESFLKRVAKLLKVHQIDKFVDVFKFFNNYSQQTPSCVVSRSLLQLFYMPKTNMVFGETELIKVVKESCKQFLKPPILSANISLDTGIKEIIEAFFYRCLVFFKNIIQTYGHNRASQRSKIAIVLKDLFYLIEECITLEQYINTKLNNSCGYLQIWVFYYKFYLMSQYLLNGFELELYSEHEFCYMYFELDYIWEYLTFILRRATEVYIEHDVYLSNSSNNNNNMAKNRKKSVKSKNQKNKMNVHDEMIFYYRGMSQLAAALHRVLMAFSLEGKIKQPKQSLNSEQIRYAHRFAPLLQFDGSLQSYIKYKKRYDYFADSGHTSHLYQEACQLFEQARVQFDQVKDPAYRDEVQAYSKVARTNLVVVKLIISGHSANAKIDLNFSESPYFPIIKFQKTDF